MFKKLFNGYRKKSRQVGKVKWLIATAIQARAKQFAIALQSKSQRVPIHYMKWYLGCFCALGLTLSLVSVLASGEPNRTTVAIQPIAVTHVKKSLLVTTSTPVPKKLQQAEQIEQYLDSLLRNARTRNQGDSFLIRHRGLQDSILQLKSLYLLER